MHNKRSTYKNTLFGTLTKLGSHVLKLRVYLVLQSSQTLDSAKNYHHQKDRSIRKEIIAWKPSSQNIDRPQLP